jgi:hypothetical protein
MSLTVLAMYDNTIFEFSGNRQDLAARRVLLHASFNLYDPTTDIQVSEISV